MRVALRPNPRRQQVATGASLPSPVGGWNAVDPVSNMPPEDALQLDNWIPRKGFCELRRGFTQHSTTATSNAVESILPYRGVSSNKIFAAANTVIYDATTFQGTASSSVTSLTNARWQHINVATSGGNFLWICNGADTPRYYDGSSWSSATITGITSSQVIGCALFKNKIWMVRTGTLNAAYLPTDSVQGAATVFSLTGIFNQGGVLQAIGSWSLDGGAGQDDLLCFITSRGQVAVYQGSDPATDFSLVGVFDTAPPIGRRCLAKLGGDLGIVTIDGVLPISAALKQDRAANSRISLTQKIQPVYLASARDHASKFGWELVSYPRGGLGIINVPLAQNTQQHQYVLTTETGAMCRFTGWNGSCFGVVNDKLYMGGNNGKIYEVDRGGDDGGAAITADLKTAWNYLKSRGRLKKFKLYRALVTADLSVSPALALNVDFRDDALLSTIANSATVTALFDQAIFDTDVFPQENRVLANWVQANGLGYAASIYLRAQVVSASVDEPPPDALLQVHAFDILYEDGGLIGG